MSVSNLPDPLAVHVLSFLDSVDVATVASARILPKTAVFSETLWKELQDRALPRSLEFYDETKSGGLSNVDHIMEIEEDSPATNYCPKCDQSDCSGRWCGRPAAHGLSHVHTNDIRQHQKIILHDTCARFVKQAHERMGGTPMRCLGFDTIHGSPMMDRLARELRDYHNYFVWMYDEGRRELVWQGFVPMNDRHGGYGQNEDDGTLDIEYYDYHTQFGMDHTGASITPPAHWQIKERPWLTIVLVVLDYNNKPSVAGFARSCHSYNLSDDGWEPACFCCYDASCGIPNESKLSMDRKFWLYFHPKEGGQRWALADLSFEMKGSREYGIDEMSV